MKSEQKVVDAANKRMRDIYSPVWSKARGVTASDSPVRYFDYNDNPVIMERGKFPMMTVKGKDVVIYDQFKLLNNSEEITEKEYLRMKGGKSKKSSIVAKTLSDDKVREIAQKVLKNMGIDEGEEQDVDVEALANKVVESLPPDASDDDIDEAIEKAGKEK